MAGTSHRGQRWARAAAAAAGLAAVLAGSRSAAFAQAVGCGPGGCGGRRLGGGGGPRPRQPPAGASPSVPEPRPLQEVLAAFLAAVLVAASAAPPAVQARDGNISPPTCVSIINAETNCPARQAKGAKVNAEAQVKAAQDQLAAAEKAAGKTLGPGESQNGEPELVEFWKAEVRRLEMTREYLKSVRADLLGDQSGSASSTEVKPSKPLRWLSRLAIVAPDVKKEVSFWCEAVGMQRYLDLPDGGAVVAFGPPVLTDGDEGAFFGVEIRPALPASSAGSSSTLGAAKLSFVQVATPSLIRISKVMSSGGELIDGYGYYAIRSPAGVDIRAYVDDRRDPVELVALAAPEGAEMEKAAQGLQALGLEQRGPYVKVSPETQGYMPEIPPGNMMYGGTASGGTKQTVQVLLLPIPKEATKSFFDELPRGPALVTDENGKPSLGLLDQPEKPETTLSPVQGAGLEALAPAGTAARLEAAAGSGGAGVLVRLRTAEGAA